tara:strand:+ start:2885 stop:3625 length:741 start_codon:yes stop_codon:yes gene_type:complete
MQASGSDPELGDNWLSVTKLYFILVFNGVVSHTTSGDESEHRIIRFLGGAVDQVRKRKSAADRKAEIVDTVIKLSAVLGPDRVTTQHLADAVGVTQPAIFRHFSTKSEIWDEVSRRIAADINEMSESVESPQTGLRDYINRFLSFVSERPAVPAILHSIELQVENTELRNRFTALNRDSTTRVARLIERGQERSEIRAELSATGIAGVVMTSLQGLSHDWLLKDQAFDLESAGNRLADDILAMIGA